MHHLPSTPVDGTAGLKREPADALRMLVGVMMHATHTSVRHTSMLCAVMTLHNHGAQFHRNGLALGFLNVFFYGNRFQNSSNAETLNERMGITAALAAPVGNRHTQLRIRSSELW